MHHRSFSYCAYAGCCTLVCFRKRSEQLRDLRNRVPAGIRANGNRRTGAAERPDERGHTRRDVWRQLGEAELLRRQPHADGVPGLLGESLRRLLPRVSDGLPGPQHQLGAAVHAAGHLVEEEPPVERHADRNRDRVCGQRDDGDQPGAAQRSADGIVGTYGVSGSRERHRAADLLWAQQHMFKQASHRGASGRHRWQQYVLFAWRQTHKRVNPVKRALILQDGHTTPTHWHTTQSQRFFWFQRSLTLWAM